MPPNKPSGKGAANKSPRLSTVPLCGEGNMTLKKYKQLITEFELSDFERSLEFYVDVLGFEIEERSDDPGYALLSNFPSFVARAISAKCARFNLYQRDLGNTVEASLLLS